VLPGNAALAAGKRKSKDNFLLNAASSTRDPRTPGGTVMPEYERPGICHHQERQSRSNRIH